MMHEIAKHAHGEGAKQVMAKRKLDSLGNVRGDCGFANDPECMKRGSRASCNWPTPSQGSPRS
jgi:hypothetical protein